MCAYVNFMLDLVCDLKRIEVCDDNNKKKAETRKERFHFIIFIHFCNESRQHL